MKKSLFFLIPILCLSLFILSCRPPELESAFLQLKRGEIDNAYNSALAAADLYPHNPEAWFILGDLQGKKGLTKDMMESFEKSLSLSKTYGTQIANAKNEYYGQYYNEGVNSYNEFIKIEDKTSDQARKSGEAVVANFEKCTFIKNDYGAIRLISMVYQSTEDNENSIKYLHKAAEANPDTVLAWVDLGFYYLRLKDYEKAEENFGKGVKVSPNNIECLTMRAQCLDFANKKDEAIKAYKEAFEKNPEEKAIPFNLGLLLYKQSLKDGIDDSSKKTYLNDAADYLTKAHNLDPELKEIYDLLGVILVQLERYDEAKEILEQGIDIFPDESNIWYNLGVIYAKQNNSKKAKEAFDRADQLK